MCLEGAKKKQEAEMVVETRAKLEQVINEGCTKIEKLEDYNKKLHNRKLELKGNIRVFCRVRPILQSDIEVMLKKMSKDYMPTSIQSKQKIVELKKNKGYDPKVEDLISY